jgi:NADP-dependent 3-hydroxy acid dehydrogenase YdfG
MNMMQLQGKIAWITGAGSGIGQATARALAQAGAIVVLTGRRAESLEETAHSIGKAATVMVGDVTDAQRMAQIARDIATQFDRLDIVVNNAGMNIVERKWAVLQPEAIDTVIATNLNSAFYCVTAALPVMRPRKDGLFVHVGSRAARIWDGPSGAGYIASKAGLVAMSDSINREEFLNGIRSTVVNPGETVTPILKTRRVPMSDEELAKLLRPEDCADLIRYIACLPPHVCVNEVLMTPTWNRSFVRGVS